MDGHDDSSCFSPSDGSAGTCLPGSVRRAIACSRQWLRGQQQPDGHWVGELEGDTILESEIVLLWAFLGREQSSLARRAARYLIEKQLPEGGWAMYPGGRAEISGSVKAYFALKLTGHDPSEEYMQRARSAILAQGGADAVNSYTRFYLALLGQIPYRQCPAVPPEVLLLPRWFPGNLSEVSAWSRTMIVPLAVVSASQPVRRIEPQRGIRELFVRDPKDWTIPRCPGLPGGTGLFSWDRFFRTADRALHWCQRKGWLPLRRRALRAAEQWLLGHFEGSEGLGAIYPPMIWSIVALGCLGYEEDSPELERCFEHLHGLVLEDETSDTVRVQPCKSPVWDTALTMRALAASGLRGDDRAMVRASRWLLDRQIDRAGDWSATVAAEPGGWCFEYRNDHYPDADDTAMVLMAMKEQFDERSASDVLPASLRLVEEEEDVEESAVLEDAVEAIRRGEAWLLAMQNKDGGWGAFDRDNDREFLRYVPLADHNAMIDPSTPDLTGRVLEALGSLGRRVGDRAVDRAVAYLRGSQEPDGSWFGRWGVNYVYGTWQALTGLVACGVSAENPMVVAGAQWLLAYQQPNGGWGESPETYTDPRLRGQGPTTASQTAWALMGLLAAGLESHPAVVRGVQYLLDSQEADGTWDEREFTGTGFPRVFYLRYHYYPIYFPLLALSRWAATGSARRVTAAVRTKSTVAGPALVRERAVVASV